MAKADSTRATGSRASIESAALLVPRFVHNLNVIAKAAGFSIEGTSVEKFHKNDDYQSIVTIWRGSRAAFRALTFLPLGIRKRACISDSGITVGWPERVRGRPTCNPIFFALYRNSRKGIELTVDGGPLPKMIRHQGDIEIIEYDNTIAYHGTKQALIAAGICDEKKFPNKHCSKSSRDSYFDTKRAWDVKRHPDGMFVYWFETEEACKQRSRRFNENVASAKQLSMPFSECQKAETYRVKHDARTDEEKAAARGLLANAESDKAFQRFISQLPTGRQQK